MDIEAALRDHLNHAGEFQNLTIEFNDEGRVLLTIKDPDGSTLEYVAVGDKLLAWPIKPPAQKVGAFGFDDFRTLRQGTG